MCLNPIRIPNPVIPKEFRPSIGRLDHDLKGSLDHIIQIASNRVKNELLFNIRDYIRLDVNGFKKSDEWRYSPFMFVPCRKCVECARSNASQWRFRLSEESKNYSSSANHLFATFTFDNFHYSENDYSFVGRFIRDMHDKMYSRFGRRIKHWYITEKGSKKGRLHLHGIIYDFPSIYIPVNTKYEYRFVKYEGKYRKYCHYKDFTEVKYTYEPGYKKLDMFELKSYFEEYFWQYGFTFFGYVNEKTFNYVGKYITKFEDYTDSYRPRVYSSPGIGRSDERIIADKLSTLSLSSGNFLFSTGSRVTILPKYYRDRIRKFINVTTYYRCMDRTIQAFGLSYRFDGKNYDSFQAMQRAKYRRYQEDVRKYPDMYKNYENTKLQTITLTEKQIYGFVTSIPH